MSATTELRAFQAFLDEKISKGGAEVLPEEVLKEWRQLHPEPLNSESAVAAIQAALDDRAKGLPSIPLDQVDRELRTEFNLPNIAEP